MLKSPAILVERARTHNLKGVSCSVPHGAVTVVTGPSGAGKSSLAFDTIFAEGQRRFVESMSTYARQFLDQMERPPVDATHNILPAVALEAKNAVRNARSTVGTITETLDVLRLLRGERVPTSVAFRPNVSGWPDFSLGSPCGSSAWWPGRIVWDLSGSSGFPAGPGPAPSPVSPRG